MNPATCRSCGRLIFWCKTKNNRAMPLDRERSTAGNIEIIDGVGVVVEKGGSGAMLWISHFATCPNAKKHKRAPVKGGGPIRLNDNDMEEVMSSPGICKMLPRANPVPIHLVVEQPYRNAAEIQPDILAAIRECYTGKKPWPLTIWGQPGRGKTCAALSFLDRGTGPYLTVPILCQLVIDVQQDKVTNQDMLVLSQGRDILKGWDPVYGVWKLHPRQFWEYAGKWPIVVMDEVGLRETVSDAHRETVKQMLDARSGKVLIVCSNHDVHKLGLIYGQAVGSRLEGGTVVYASGPDRRKEHSKREVERLKAEGSAAIKGPESPGAG